jgi:hypothetical protein
MSPDPIEIANLLAIMPNDLIQVPGCEPPSSISTLRFAAYYAQSGCEGALVTLESALEALPGSEVVYSVNFGPPNFRAKWLRLPPTYAVCPCPGGNDWYGILKALPKAQVEEEESLPCALETADWCQDQDYAIPPAPDTYFDEGEFPVNVGFIPPLTPNQKD